MQMIDYIPGDMIETAVRDAIDEAQDGAVDCLVQDNHLFLVFDDACALAGETLEMVAGQVIGAGAVFAPNGYFEKAVRPYVAQAFKDAGDDEMVAYIAALPDRLRLPLQFGS